MSSNFSDIADTCVGRIFLIQHFIWNIEIFIFQRFNTLAKFLDSIIIYWFHFKKYVLRRSVNFYQHNIFNTRSISTNVVSSNPVHREVYTTQHYVMKFVSDLRQVGGFLRVLWFSPPINRPPRSNWNIVESGVKHHKPPKPTSLLL